MLGHQLPKIRRRAVLAALAASCGSVLLPRRSWPAAGESRVQALLDQYVAQDRLAGAVAVIGSRNGPKFVASGRIATMAGAAVAAPDSLWRVYSMTKLITGAAAMLLVEDGKLDLEMPVARVFPTFGQSEVLMSPAGPGTRRAKTAVTVRHLMTHTSGLVGSMVPEPPLSTFYLDRKLNVSRVSLEDDAKVTHQTDLASFSLAAGTVPLAFDPGTQWSYGISSDVLGGVVEKVSGVPFDRFLETRIFRPLGMNDTGFAVSRENLGRLATNYQVTSEGLEAIDSPPRSIFATLPPFPYPSSGLVSSARDFARFAGMLLGEGTSGDTRVLARRTATQMMSNLLPAGLRAQGEGWGAGGMVLLGSAASAGSLGKTAGTYGWEGAAGTTCWVDRATGLYAVLMTQFMPNRAYALHSEFAEAVLAG